MKHKSNPRMGVTRNKMYKYKPGEQPSIPAMGKGGGKGITWAPFAAIGSAGQSQADQMKANVKAAYDRLERPGQRRTGKGTYAWNTPEDKARGEAVASNQIKGINSIFNSNPNTSMSDRISNISIPRMGPKMVQTATGVLNGRTKKVSIPRMGPVGATGGAYVGKKLGSWVGSAGKLIGKKHEKYGRLAGEYIGGSVGGVFGGLLSPI